MGWFILIFIVVVFFIAIMQGNSNINEFEKKYNKKVSDLLFSGTYVSGHPNLDKPLKDTRLLLDSDLVKLFIADANGFNIRAEIPKSSITNVSMEDASTIQKRVTVGRLLLTGIFAFAWKKKEKIENAYFVIEWKKGNFNNETIFELEGTGSIQRANTLRNRFINYLEQ